MAHTWFPLKNKPGNTKIERNLHQNWKPCQMGSKAGPRMQELFLPQKRGSHTHTHTHTHTLPPVEIDRVASCKWGDSSGKTWAVSQPPPLDLQQVLLVEIHPDEKWGAQRRIHCTVFCGENQVWINCLSFQDQRSWISTNLNSNTIWPVKKLGPKGRQTGAHFKEETDFRSLWILTYVREWQILIN